LHNLIRQIVRGAKADIYVYAPNKRRKSEVETFIDNLSKSEQKKVLALLNYFAENGFIRNEEKFKLEQKPIYSFKCYQIRICCFFYPKAPKKSIVLTNSFKKKKDRMPQTELEKALSINQLITG
jgi:hypothetical protein